MANQSTQPPESGELAGSAERAEPRTDAAEPERRLHAHRPPVAPIRDRRFGLPHIPRPWRADYRLDRSRATARTLRVSYIIGFGLYAAYLLQPETVRPSAATMALFVFLALPPAALTLFKSMGRNFASLNRWAALSYCANAAAAVAYQFDYAREGLLFPGAGIALVMAYGLWFTGLSPLPSLSLTALFLIGSRLASLFGGIPMSVTIHRCLPLGALWMLAGATGLVQEARMRRHWLTHRLADHSSRSDALTGLRNRRHLFEQGQARLEQARREGTDFAVLMIDVDHFKLFNDAQGHLRGDSVLHVIGDALHDFARRPLDLAARYGGEEFVVVLFGCAPSHAAERAEALRQRIMDLDIPHPAAPDGRVTITVGVACVPQGRASSFAELLEAADRCLYDAKREGRNRVHLAPIIAD